jgi:hypothetical protein
MSNVIGETGVDDGVKAEVVAVQSQASISRVSSPFRKVVFRN